MPEVTLADVQAAADRIRPFVRQTPVLTSATFDKQSGRRLFFKCEQFQRTGSFKYRGATNAVQKLDAATAARGVVTHSSGNHAQALALAAKVRGIPATIVMPRTAPAVKKQAVIGYGGRVIECEPNVSERLRVAKPVG
jgi:threonine dehydratase/serine racemase